MAIRVTYGDVAAYGQLGVAAGQAEAERTAQEELVKVQMQQAQLAAQSAAQENQLAYGREMAQLDAFLQKEATAQEHAWSVEEADLRRRHDFDMEMRAEDFKRDMDMQDWTRRNGIRQRKLEALDQALKDNIIDQEQYNSLKLANELDIEPYPESIGLQGRGGKTSLLDQLMAGEGGEQPEQGPAATPFQPGQTQITAENIAGILGTPQNVKMLASMPAPAYAPTGDYLQPGEMGKALGNIIPILPEGQRAKVQAILATGNQDLIRQAFEAVQKENVPASFQNLKPSPLKGTSIPANVVAALHGGVTGERTAITPRQPKAQEPYSGTSRVLPRSLLLVPWNFEDDVRAWLDQGLSETEVLKRLREATKR